MISNNAFSRIVRMFIGVAALTAALTAGRVSAGQKPKVALIFDDFGYSSPRSALMKGFLELDCRFTASVIPCLKYSNAVAGEFARSGMEIILHMPMETENCLSDGPCELKISMSAKKMKETLRGAMKSVPYAAGLSNHMGSMFTADSGAVARLMKALEGSNLYFIDSRTDVNSCALETARAKGLPSLRRDVFLDVDMQPGEVVFDRFQQLVYLAMTRGYAVGVGHCHEETLKAMKKFLSSGLANEVELVTPSQIIEELKNAGEM